MLFMRFILSFKYHVFNALVPFILSFKYHVFNAVGRSVRPKRVACANGADKIDCV
jgi:hypothetical protein